MYTIVIIILICLFAFCCWGFTLSLKHHNKIKDLQASADYNFETTQGAYSFKYLIKAFNNNNEKLVKIIIAPEIGFSDLKNYKTNNLLSYSVEVNSKKPTQSVCFGKDLAATITVELTPDYFVNGVLNANFKITTSWSFSTIINDTLEFTFNK